MKKFMELNLKKVIALGSVVTMSIPGITGCGKISNKTPTSNVKDYKNLNSQVSATKNKSNVVVIVLDDMGFSDFGCYGSEIKTPNIDKLAQNGLRYNNFNVEPLSSPTRASLLSGRNCHSVGVKEITNFDFGTPNSAGRVTPNAALMSQVLKEAGYNTMAVGKWHLAPGLDQTASGPYANWPVQKGFERYYGYLDGETDQYQPNLVYDNHYVDPPRTDNYNFMTDITDNAVAFLRDQVTNTPDKPFMLYMATSAVHKPIQVPDNYIKMYDGVYDKGWDAIKQQRFQSQKSMGLIPQNTVLSPRDTRTPAWDSLSDKEKKLYAKYMQAYAGFLTQADEQVGRVIDELTKLNKMDNTIIYLVSDNGSNSETGELGCINMTKFFNGIPNTFDENYARIDEIGKASMGYSMGWAEVM